MKRLLGTLWRDLRCLFARDCAVFTGDEFTAWLEQQRQASERAQRNPLEAAYLGTDRPAEGADHE